MQDWIHAARTLRKQPVYALAAIIALGLAIGANTAMISAADALLFRPLNLPRIDRLVLIYGGAEGAQLGDVDFTPADYYDLQERARSVAQIGAYNFRGVNLTGAGGPPERVQAIGITRNMFGLLGVEALVGRGFRTDAPENHTVILSHGFWMRRFAGDPKIVGRTVQLNGQSHEVIGVASEQMRFPPMAEIWLPIVETPAMRQDRADFSLRLVARLKDGVSYGQSEAELLMLGRQLAAEHPLTHKGRGATLRPFREYLSGAFVGDFTRMQIVAASFLLLIACANVANLHFARVSGRTKEISLRQALGSTRARIIRQLLVESLMLGAGGLVLGLVIASWFIELIKSGMPPEVETFLPGWRTMRLSGFAFFYAAAAGLVTSIFSGIAPAWQASGVDLIEALKDGNRGGSTGPSRSRLRNALVIAQVALSLILLVGGVLITRGTTALAEPSRTFAAANAMTVRVNLPLPEYGTDAAREQFLNRVLAGLRESPRVESAATMTNLPYSSNWWTTAFEKEGFAGAKGERPVVHVQRIDDELLRTLRLPIQAGRGIERTDGPGRQRVAVINQTLATRAFGRENPIGKRVRIDDDTEWTTVVGVTADYSHDWVLRGPTPMIFLPFRQRPVQSLSFLVRPRPGVDPTALAREIRQSVSAVDATLPVFALRTLEKVINDNLVGIWYVAGFLSVAGVLSLVLAVTGLYSLMSFVVTDRTRELGIRMALGAESADVLRMTLHQGARLIGWGAVIGLAGSIGLAKLIGSLIFGVSEFDVLSLAGSTILLLAAGLLACYGPARRAASVDPMVALRYE